MVDFLWLEGNEVLRFSCHRIDISLESNFFYDEKVKNINDHQYEPKTILRPFGNSGKPIYIDEIVSDFKDFQKIFKGGHFEAGRNLANSL